MWLVVSSFMSLKFGWLVLPVPFMDGLHFVEHLEVNDSEGVHISLRTVLSVFNLKFRS